MIDFQRHAGWKETLDCDGLCALEHALGWAAHIGGLLSCGMPRQRSPSVALALGVAAMEHGARLERRSVARLVPKEGGISLAAEGGTPARFNAAIMAVGAWSRPLAVSSANRIRSTGTGI